MDKELFGKTLLDWHKSIDRNLPWKSTDDPYNIWISEIVMQQTRVAQGLDYYNRIIDALPTVHDMASAAEDDILYLWKGLGYYSRARNMHRAAKMIVDEYDGIFPSTHESLLSLPGVGPYTAAAIASFAYELPHAVLDGNVYRVLSRYFGIETPIDSSKGKKQFAQLSQECLGRHQPSHYNQAIMDFGALQCKPKSPNCGICCLQKHCWAYHNDGVALLPIKEKRIKRKDRHLYFFMFSSGEHTYIQRRGKGDIWQGLYQLPMIEAESDKRIEDVIKEFSDKQDLMDLLIEPDYYSTIQKLTHQTIHATIIKGSSSQVLDGFMRVEYKDIMNYAFPILIEKYLQEYLKRDTSF